MVPIGKQLELRETDEGLYGRWSVVDTTAGTDAYKLAKAGVLDSLSIGYVPLEWETRADGVRVLQKVELYEVSAVAIPANESAVITAVKRLPEPEPTPAEPAPPPLSFDLDDVRRCLAALGVDPEDRS
jgi:HK97 family phage prohead protease